MTAQEIAAHRLRAQHLRQAGFEHPGALVRGMGAVQGQDYAGAMWSVGLRLPGSRKADVEAALNDRSIVRTWAMRGTLHLVAGADVPWLLGLIAPRVIAQNARRYRQLELDEQTLSRSNSVLARALDGKRLSRPDLLATLERNGISTEGQRGAYLLQRASLDRVICQSVSLRNVSHFDSLDHSDPGAMSRDEALAELAGRYFRSRGPATLQDFMWWSGLLAADARAGLESVKSQLMKASIAGETYWFSTSVPEASGRSPRAWLLPGFDEYLLAYKDRSGSIPPEHAAKMGPTYGMLKPTVVVDGRVIGIWKRVIKKNRVLITTDFFESPSRAVAEAVARAAEEFAGYLEVEIGKNTERGGAA